MGAGTHLFICDSWDFGRQWGQHVVLVQCVVCNFGVDGFRDWNSFVLEKAGSVCDRDRMRLATSTTDFFWTVRGFPVCPCTHCVGGMCSAFARSRYAVVRGCGHCLHHNNDHTCVYGFSVDFSGGFTMEKPSEMVRSLYGIGDCFGNWLFVGEKPLHCPIFFGGRCGPYRRGNVFARSLCRGVPFLGAADRHRMECSLDGISEADNYR